MVHRENENQSSSAEKVAALAFQGHVTVKQIYKAALNIAVSRTWRTSCEDNVQLDSMNIMMYIMKATWTLDLQCQVHGSL